MSKSCPSKRKQLFHKEIDKEDNEIINAVVMAHYYPATDVLSISNGFINNHHTISCMVSTKIYADGVVINERQ